jgi:endonuclease G
MMKRSLLGLVLLTIAACSLSQDPESPVGKGSEAFNPNARFGLPSAAKADPVQREDYLIERPQYVLS